jgi:1-acyl-sn-glycerol-3-phosphate acyltransferase
MTEVGRRVGLDPQELRSLRDAAAALRAELDARFGTRAFAVDEPRESAAEAAAAPASGWLDGLRGWLGEIDPMQLFDDVRARLAGMRGETQEPEVDAFGLDRQYLERARSALDFLYDSWWAVAVSGAEHVPDAGATLFVANRSGILPWDGLMIAHAVEREGPRHERPRFLVADWLVTLPFVQPALARLGGVRACQENADRLLRSGESVVSFPEGQKGALKPFRERYRLQRFGRGGVVSLAVRRGCTVVPVAVVGAEEAHPVLLRPQLVERLLGLPLPITPTFPLLGPLGAIPLPSQWRIRFGAPLRFDGVPPERADDPLYTNRTREEIRGAIQTLLDEEVRRRSGVF